MTFQRGLAIARVLVPLLVAAGAAVAWGGGGLNTAMVLAVLIGGLLGWTVMLSLQGVFALAGLVQSSSHITDRRLQQLERDKLLVLRSIKAIELDAAIQRLDSDEADRLSAPLRARAKRILRQLDETRQTGSLTVAEQIERELASRLAPGAGTDPETGGSS